MRRKRRTSKDVPATGVLNVPLIGELGRNAPAQFVLSIFGFLFWIALREAPLMCWGRPPGMRLSRAPGCTLTGGCILTGCFECEAAKTTAVRNNEVRNEVAFIVKEC